MDEIAQYHIKRWKALAEANALFTRPFFDLTAAEAPGRLDPEGRLGDLAGKNVLCLAGGGGRQSALLGFVNGLSTGAAYGLVRSQLDDLPVPLAGIVVGLTAMAASDLPLVAARASNPKTWGVSGWLADLIPHLIYGFVTVATYEALAE